jgi:phytoene synthase
MTPELTASYRAAEEVARTRARNFYYSFVVLPSEKRRALCAVYAFMRFCDDISDGSAPIPEKRALLETWRTRLECAFAEDFEGNPILPAFSDTVHKFRIPIEYFHWAIDGAEMDLTTDRYQTFDELYRYCFNVASTVGLICIQIFGFTDERAKKHAEHCGIAFQLTNILRDVKEDAGMGRIYLPCEDLTRFRYSPEDLRGRILDERFQRLMAYQTERARKYYTQGRNLFPLIEEACRPALWAMMEIYDRLLRKIVRQRYDVFQKSIRLSNREKASIALRALAMRFIPGKIWLSP